MREIISGFLSNESTFGRIMTKIAVIVGANLMFVIFSLPVVTVGASLAALYHVMLKALRGDGAVNPIKQFWIGFKTNFKQATIAWLLAIVLVAVGYADVRICLAAGGFIGSLRYAVYAMGIALVVVMIFLYPTMAAFENTLPNLAKFAVYFALRRPFRLVVLLFFNVFPLYLTYTDPTYLPLYAFIWTFFGFGAIAMLGATLLIKDFKPYLPLVDSYGDFVLDENGEKQKPDKDGSSAGSAEKSEREILDEMNKLGM